MNKRRKNGLATHAYLLMRVTLYPLHYLIVPHAYQRRMNVMFRWILLKYLLWVKLVMMFLCLLPIVVIMIGKSTPLLILKISLVPILKMMILIVVVLLVLSMFLQ